MAKNSIYMAVGEEAIRNTAESSTVGFIPLNEPAIPSFEPDDQKRNEVRGEDASLGDREVRRFSRKWSYPFSVPMYSESGGQKEKIMQIIKHCLGFTKSTQNGTTGQYAHMSYPVINPFENVTNQLNTKALTYNINLNQTQGATANMKNWPYIGGRNKSLEFVQEVGSPLIMNVESFGQTRGAVINEIGSPVFPAANLRFDYNNLKVYTGVITRVGTAPNFTDFTFGSATQVKPDKISCKVEAPYEDKIRLSGLDYADITKFNGKFLVTFEMTIDWADPASGFSSVDEFNNWVSSIGSSNFFLHWDTGTQAGTGDNHQFYIDLPVMNRVFSSNPEYSLENDPIITLNYEGLFDSTTANYIIGIMLKNTAASI